jgi:glycosyltransferase involved in cell wall biosynthesis
MTANVVLLSGVNHMLLKKKIVVSAVNITEGGTLTIVREFLSSLVKFSCVDVIAYVHKADLYEFSDNLTVIECADIKTSWLKRLWFEYFECRSISSKVKPDLWISLHDTSPSIMHGEQVVYCHNPSPFYVRKLTDAYYSPKFYIFTWLYKYLYKINIKKNKFVIVQQNWIADAFEEMYGIGTVIVSRPETDISQYKKFEKDAISDQVLFFDDKLVFFYPSLSRTFKNFEVICEAVKRLEPNVRDKIRVILTIDGTEDLYSRSVFDKYRTLSCIEFVGKLTHEQVIEQYKSTSVVIFPSRLETWGLPITEAKRLNLPLMVSDLPYAHETVGDYDRVVFFDSLSAAQLSAIISDVSRGKYIFGHHEQEVRSRLSIDGFDSLIAHLLNDG